MTNYPYQEVNVTLSRVSLGKVVIPQFRIKPSLFPLSNTLLFIAPPVVFQLIHAVWKLMSSCH